MLSSQEILERVADGVAVVDASGAGTFPVIWHNRAFADLAGAEQVAGQDVYEALGLAGIERAHCPFLCCLAGEERASTKLQLPSGRCIEMTAIDVAESRSSGRRELLAIARDITAELNQRKKLIAIHRAGMELSHLTPAELAQMSTAERIDLLKANITQYSQSVLNFKNLEIRLLDVATNQLRVLLSVGMTVPAEDRELFALPTGNGVTGYVAATGKSYRCDDVERDPLYLSGAPDARSSLTVPVVYRDRVVGTFNVESPEPNHFAESDEEFLEVFAREIAVALNTLDLLQAEKQFGGSASVDAVIGAVSLPVDEILADATGLLNELSRADADRETARHAIDRILANARAVRGSIQRIGRHYDVAPGEGEREAVLAERRVLLVDADPAVRRAAHCLLARVGCLVETARDAAEAGRLASVFHYDVVMGDIRLPDATGYEFFTSLRKAAPHTPIVLMTGFGYDPSHSIVKARQEGLAGVLYKPFRIERLVEVVLEAIDPTRSVPIALSAKHSLL